VLGAEKTKDELIPYISDCLDDEDHVLLAFSEEIPKFIQYLAGDSAFCLLPPLETLATNEDSKVRSKSVEGIVQVCSVLSDENLTSHVLPLVSRLAAADWWTPRTSACGIISSIFPRVSSEDKSRLKDIFFNLCRDVTPMVRRSAFTGLADFIPVVDKDVVKDEIIHFVNTMSSDNQDSVRLLSIETCISLAKVLDFEENQTLTRPIFIASVTDLSWRVRYMVALRYYDAARLLNPDYDEELVNHFLNLLKDTEPEVRKATATNIAGMGEYLPTDIIIEKLLPVIRILTRDDKIQVRDSLALSITSLVHVLGEDNSKTHLLELIEILLTDKESQVRLNVISTLHKLLSVVNINNVSRLILDAIEHLSSDVQWRIRLKIIEYIPNMSTQLGVEFFNANLLGLCLSWLEDSVYTVRMAAIDNLKTLTDIFGLEWCITYVVPKFVEKSSSSVFLQRMTALFAIERFLVSVSEETVGHFFTIVTERMSDPVPNIRFNACRMLNQFALRNVDLKVVVPKLTEMLEDNDPEVCFHAGQALKVLL